MIGYLSNNIMLPILDFFYGIVPSYGLAIVALTLVIRFALYPVSAGQIRNMRRMKIAQPVMKKRQAEIKERYKDNPAKMQEEQAKVMQEFGNPLAGCLPLLIQMPILFALFATLRGSPFADITYTVNLKVLPQDKIEQVIPEAFQTKPQNVYVDEGIHYSIAAMLADGNRLAVGDQTQVELNTLTGKPLTEVLENYSDHNIKPTWQVTKGADVVEVDAAGHLTALQTGDVTLQGKVTGIASRNKFLFIQALGRVGAFEGKLMTETDDGGTQFNSHAIHWDILLMVIGFGVSLYVNQLLSGQSSKSDDQQQQMMTKFLPVMMSGMFLFFPLPAGVLLYMLIANVFQTVQSFFLAREPLPDNLQEIVDADAKRNAKSMKSANVKDSGSRGKPLPFEPEYSKKNAES